MMTKQPDADGRYALSGREYDSIRYIWTAFSTLDAYSASLKDRLKLIPGGWRDIRLLHAVSKNLERKLFDTVPIRKAAAMKAEMNNSSLTMSVRMADQRLPGIMYMDEHALIALIDLLVSRECLLCEKCGKDAKRCVIRRTIEDVMHYDLEPAPNPEDCPLAGWITIRREEAECETGKS